MSQSNGKKPKTAVALEDFGSSSEDEMKSKKKEKSGSSKTGKKKTFEKKRPKEKGSKDSKKSLVDGKYTDIKLSSYMCVAPTQAPKDAHVVEIDTYGVCCQMWEMYRSKTQTNQNVSFKKAELYAVLCSALAILENIVLGVRYSDIPTLVVEMFPRTRICVREDYMEAVHACSIPKGKVFIGRGNKSVGYLAAFISAVNPTAISDNTSLNTVEANVVNILTNKGFDSPIVTPPDGQDACLQDFVNAHRGTKSGAEQLVLGLRNVMLEANAAIADLPDYHLYVPVLCEQSEVCYVLSGNGDVHLVSFMPISNESTLKRLKIYALSFRFFISYVRVMKENKALVNAEEVENDMLEQGYLPIFQKHGMMVLKKRMDEEGDDDEKSVLVEDQVSVPPVQAPREMDVVQFNFNSDARGKCLASEKFITRAELKTFIGLRVRISNDGMIALQTLQGEAITMLSGKQRSGGKQAKDSWFMRVPDNPSRKWSKWTDADGANKVVAWVDGLPNLPENW